MAAAHMRLYNAFYSEVLNVSSIVGYNKLIYTTAVKGSFFINFTCTEPHQAKDDAIHHWVRLVVDCKEGWCFGFVNRNGHFEFKHKHRIPYIIHNDREMLDFQGDYSPKGIAPDGHGAIKMGCLPMRMACKAV